MAMFFLPDLILFTKVAVKLSKHERMLPLHVNLRTLIVMIFLKGVVKVAAVDMDDQQNQALGGQYGIRGFPTIKVSSFL